jgi:hypothetical protein
VELDPCRCFYVRSRPVRRCVRAYPLTAPSAESGSFL